jgi:hypothetical protein
MDKDITVALLEFLRSLLWPAVFVWIVIRFRAQVEKLLERLTTVKVAGNEFAFQQPAANAAPPAPTARVEISQIGPDGFFTAEGIRDIVSQSGLLPAGEKAASELLLFDTGHQHTWLVASPSRVMIVLDDEETRALNQLVQVVMDKNNVLPLKFSARDGEGLVSFGSDPTRWYYSFSLFPTSESLERRFKKLLDRSA